MPQGGQLRLETDTVVLDDDFRNMHGFGDPGQYACIRLVDTGSGMDEETMKKIFDPFFTTKEVGRGTGLGLATVYGIVKQHGGYIVVQSKPHEGSRFEIYFPAVKAVVEDREQAPVDLAEGRETILVADDNAEIRALMKDVFALAGYRVMEAADGEEAVRTYAEAEPVDLVILDSVMPKKNGLKVFEEISRIKPDVKVLFISGYTSDIVLTKGVRDKFHFLPKPLSPNTLLKKVREVLDAETGLRG